jgi:alkylation response protein AidB-like acyl-CoA dehydrogenase
MYVILSEQERQFRDEVRDDLRAALPLGLAEARRNRVHISRETLTPWHELLARRGWSTPNWPVEHGGAGWSATERFLFEREYAMADAPPLSVFGIYLVGPTLYTFGSQDQRQKYLPGIRSGAHFWCQGYSEPNAGSDLAALRTIARKVDGGWTISGQKTWTTEAHEADFMICLARTNSEVKPQAGLSVFVVDMRSPGLSVRPIETIDFEHSVNEVYLDDVFVPDSDLVGEVDKGWTYAKFLLNHERTNNAQVHQSRREFQGLVEMARERGGLDTDPLFAHRFVEIDVGLSALELTVLRTLTLEYEGASAGGEASILKVEGSVLQQKITALAMDVLGEDAALGPAPDLNGGCRAETAGWIERHLFYRAVTIYGGSNEIQMGIVAKAILQPG